jgi:hypothetical protein
LAWRRASRTWRGKNAKGEVPILTDGASARGYVKRFYPQKNKYLWITRRQSYMPQMLGIVALQDIWKFNPNQTGVFCA